MPAENGVRCPFGEARITIAGKLNARHVIHTVGPRYGIEAEPEALLASAYRNTYQLALAHGCRTLAVPAISCGVYGYPLEEAADIAVRTSAQPDFAGLEIHFYLFSPEILAIWAVALARLTQPV